MSAHKRRSTRSIGGLFQQYFFRPFDFWPAVIQTHTPQRCPKDARKRFKDALVWASLNPPWKIIISFSVFLGIFYFLTGVISKFYQKSNSSSNKNNLYSAFSRKYFTKNYRQSHKMDYMLFACVLKVFFGN